MNISPPSLAELPPPPPGKTGWPWTEATPPVPELMSGGAPWPRVSIVTPSFNQAAYLEETIRSVLLQGYPNLEYFIMDGGSTDGSVEIIKKYEPWLAGWVSEKDSGQSHALNKGFKHAGGEFLGWLNSDDVYEPGMLINAIQNFQGHPDWDMIFSDCRVIDSTGAEIGFYRGEDCTLRQLLFSNRISQPTILLKKSIFDHTGGVNESLFFIMDYEWWLRIFYAGFTVRHIPGVWANFRIAAETKTSKFSLVDLEERSRVIPIFLFADQTLPIQDKVEIYHFVLIRITIDYLKAGRTSSAQQLISRVFDKTPEESKLHLKVLGSAIQNKIRKELCQLYLDAGFEAYQNRDLTKARQFILWALHFSWAPLKNRGVLSILLQSIVGARSLHTPHLEAL